jgi:Flp pilus assembly protein TadB
VAGQDERRRASDRADQEWRDGVSERLEDHERRLNEGRVRMNDLAQELAANTAISERTERNTAELLAIFNALRGFVKVGGWFGTLLKWAAAILFSAGVIWWVWKTGELPRK